MEWDRTKEECVGGNGRQEASMDGRGAEVEVQIDKTLVAALRKWGEGGRVTPDGADRTTPFIQMESSLAFKE